MSADVGISLMIAAKINNVPGIDAICGGVCGCAICHVIVETEWLPATGEPSDDERSMLEFLDEREDGSRLSCQIDINDQMDGLAVRLPRAQL